MRDMKRLGAVTLTIALGGLAWSVVRAQSTTTSPRPPAAARALPGEATLYRIDSNHSDLSFIVRHMQLTRVRGTFKTWGGAFLLDSNDPTRSTVTVVVDLASIDTGNETRDEDLRSENFFDVETYPRAVFRSTHVEESPDGLIVHGILEMHGVSKEIALPLTVIGEYEREDGYRRVGYEGEITIARADFGVVNEGNILERMGAIGKEVTIELNIAGSTRDRIAPAFSRRETPSIGPELHHLVREESVEAALARAEEVMETEMDAYDMRPSQFRALGRKLVLEGDTESAIGIYRWLEGVAPADLEPDLAFWLGEAYLVAGRRAKAAESFRQVVTSDFASLRQVTAAMELLRWTDREPGGFTPASGR